MARKIEAAVGAGRREPKAGLAMLASIFDVEAKTMLYNFLGLGHRVNASCVLSIRVLLYRVTSAMNEV